MSKKYRGVGVIRWLAKDGEDGKPGKDGIDGNPGADGTDGENAKTIKLTASSEVVKVNSDGSVTPSRIRVDYKATNTEIEYKEFYIDGEWIAKPTWIEDQGDSFLINVSHSNALFETLTIILLDDIGNRDSITITRMKDGTSVSILGSKNDPYELPSQQDGAKMGDAYIINGDLWVYDGVTTLTEATDFWNNVGRIKGDKGNAGSNYLVLGYWSEEYEYQQSDSGIPVVKRPGSGDGFLAYKLIVPISTQGEFYNSSDDPRIEWELLDSSEFTYMLEAYIEVLQAELITAEKIEALDIKTSNLKVLNGAQIGLFNIVDDALVSEYNRVESEGGSNYNVVGNLKLDGHSINILERATTEGYEGEYIYENELTYDYTGITIRMMRDDDLTGRIERSLSINSEGIFRDGQKIL